MLPWPRLSSHLVAAHRAVLPQLEPLLKTVLVEAVAARRSAQRVASRNLCQTYGARGVECRRVGHLNHSRNQAGDSFYRSDRCLTLSAAVRQVAKRSAAQLLHRPTVRAHGPHHRLDTARRRDRHPK
eukprot:SAG11_NODE_9554_length_900_cov_0.861596_1_plen_126_part_10